MYLFLGQQLNPVISANTDKGHLLLLNHSLKHGIYTYGIEFRSTLALTKGSEDGRLF